MSAKVIQKSGGEFFYLLLLTGFFLLLEISFFIQCNRAYLSDYTFVSDHLHIPATILPGMAFFIVAQLLVHLVYCVTSWGVAILAANLLHVSRDKRMLFCMAIWMLGLLTILIANQYFFPNSKFSELTSILFSSFTVRWTLGFLLLCCASVAGLALMELIRMIASKKIIYFLPVCAALIVAAIFYKPNVSPTSSVATEHRPNIFIIGVDSLRPDFLSYFGGAKATPFFDGFLNQATVFSESVTPLARTFPSWTSILTGQYPRESGVRFNLANQADVKLAHSLPAIIQSNGYETVYATDETRFSNIGKNYGFDRIVTPPTGLNDFLIGTFNDFPISNLVVNTIVGKWLFPYSYGNRPVHFTYEPDTFLKLINPVLQEQRSKPLFLAIHFCLPHSPYVWAGLPVSEHSGIEHYAATIVRVDQQLKDFFAMLKQNHLLDHAIVVLLSDHGEGLELAGDRITEADLFVAKSGGKKSVPKFYPPALDKEEVNQSAGHGTDVLGLTQYHTLLAFKLYGVGQQNVRVQSGVVSLLDIKPTLLSLVHVPSPQSSGISLAPFIHGKTRAAARGRHLFLESDYTPEAIRTVYPETRKVMLEGVQLFDIDPNTTRLIVKDSMGRMIINSKQYADIYGDWMLAVYPQNDKVMMPILVNLRNGEWTNDLHSKFGSHSPAVVMLNALKAFYGNELNRI